MKKSKQKQPQPAYISYHETVQNQSEYQSSEIDVEYEIQQILQHRIKYNQPKQRKAVQTIDREIPLHQLKDQNLEYLVKWAGYEELSWEPAQNLRNAPQIVDKYKQQNLPNRSMNSKKNRSEAKENNLLNKNENNPIKGSLSNRQDTSMKPTKHFNFSKVFPSDKHVKMNPDDSDEVIQINQSAFISKVSNNNNYQARLGCQERLLVKDSRIKQQVSMRNKKNRKRQMDADQLNHQKLEEIEIQMGNFKQKQFTLGFDQLFDDNKMPLDYCHSFQYPIKSIKQANQGQPLAKQLQNSHALSLSINQQSISINNSLQLFKDFPQLDQNILGKNIQCQEQREYLKRILKETDVFETVEGKTAKRIKLNQFIEKQNRLPKEIADQKTIRQINIDDPLSLQNQYEIDNAESQSSYFTNAQANPLKQRIKAYIRSLEEDSLALQQIHLKPCAPVKLMTEQLDDQKDADFSPKNGCFLKTEFLQEHKRSICSDCLMWRQKNEQMNQFYNQQLTFEINFDSLFLEQAVLQILNNLNPQFQQKEAKCVHLQKLLDISENKLLCQLIHKKMVKNPDLPTLMQDYSISKFVKIDSVWLAIFKIKNCSSGSALDHFKYVLADSLMLTYKHKVVQFLTR